MESMRYVTKEAKIFEFKGLTGKILKTKEIGLQDQFPFRPYCYGAASGVLSQRLSGNLGG